jgi:hypothetical protein
MFISRTSQDAGQQPSLLTLDETRRIVANVVD